MDDMLKEFVVEALDLATNVEELLLSLERNPNDMQTLNAIFRSFHTIKGGAGFMNLTAIVEACHLTENLFDALRTSKMPVTSQVIEAALVTSGFLADQLKALHNGTTADQLSLMPHELKIMITNAIEGELPTFVSTRTHLPENGADNGINWEELYKAVTPSHEISIPIVKVSSTEIKQHVLAAKEESIRIDAVKLDALLEIAGESVQAANQASVLIEKLLQFKFDNATTILMATLSETVSRASRHSSELQRATLATRMQPVGRLFQKFPRLVRELAKELEKDVELVITGAETEVDRVVVDSLYDPLVHMVRNSLDHGIETRKERALTNKPAKSTISLKAWQESSSVMIEITDDGRGMDANQLRLRAISKGLINENDAHSHEEAFQLIFLPGFSTKEVASRVSGRGVGMDVVKTAVEKHRGKIRINSHVGTGTSFLIRLPIELSIVPTMLVKTSGASLALPMSVVQRVVELPENYETVGSSAILRDQGIPLPIRSLARILGYEACAERVGIVISAESPYILALESVEGTSDLVIKPLTCIHTFGVTGTARSAEGELVLVIDLGFLLQSGDTFKAGVSN